MKQISLDKFDVTRPKAILLLIFTAILWSSGGLLIKLVNWNPLAIAGMRSAISALFILTLIRKPKLNFTFSQIAGAIAYSGTVILFVVANKMTTAANAILLQYTSPIFVAILGAVFLKERVKISDWITIASVSFGMVLFFMDDLAPGNFIGNILAIVSGLFFAIMAVCLRSQKSGSPVMTVFWGNALTAVIGIPFMFGSMPDTRSWVALVLLGVVQLGFAYVLYSIAIKKVSALESVLIPIIEPILNPTFVFLVTGEFPGPWSIVGGAIVLVSITIRCIYSVIRQQPNGVSM
jgi:Predicted permease, DMT superfamily